MMNEGVRKNEAGLFEVFHGGEMIARVSTEKMGWDTYNVAYAGTQGTIHEHRAAMARLKDWRDMKDAPRDGTWIQVRVPGYVSDFVVAWVGGLLDSDGNDAASWAVMTDQEPPDDWTDGTCWAINADCVPSTQPDAWKPLPEDA